MRSSNRVRSSVRAMPSRGWLGSLIIGFIATAVSAHGPAAEAADAARSGGTQTLRIDGAEIRLEFMDTDFSQGTEQIVRWIERSAGAVAGYYGRFPVSPLRIRIESAGGRTVRHGQAFGGAPPFVRLEVGRDVTAQALAEDWIAVHEMVHLALPEVGDKHTWLSEGLSTYVEGIARVQAGGRRAEHAWAEFVRAMPQGLPRGGDEGLDNTHTWGRTYWGGALFCLQADVEIRRRTANKFGLQDALRAVLRESGGISQDWSIERVMQTGDAATGTTVLRDLYAKWKDAPVAPDLDALWQQLGVRRSGGSLELETDAPLAATREAIMRSAAISEAKENLAD